jgi:hypothetical protein
MDAALKRLHPFALPLSSSHAVGRRSGVSTDGGSYSFRGETGLRVQIRIRLVLVLETKLPAQYKPTTEVLGVEVVEEAN